jgi:NADH-quinone oxidoreductase subunit A
MAPYFPILLFALIGTAIALVMLAIPMIVNPLRKTPEKLSAYESGFEPMGKAHKTFDVRFYLVAILFIVFDLEVAFLFPWALALHDFGWFGFISMMVFLGVLTVGFIYEWKKGALEWE